MPSRLTMLKQEMLETALVQYTMGVGRFDETGKYIGQGVPFTLAECRRYAEIPLKIEDLITVVEREQKARNNRGESVYVRTPAQQVEWDAIQQGQYNVVLRTPLDVPAIITAYADGGTLESLAQKHEVSTATIRNVLIRAGVARRKVGKRVTPKTE